MPPVLFPQLVRFALGAVGAAAAVHWVVKEVRRINAELDRVKPAPAGERVAREGMPTLRRDPRTGDYRVM